MTEQPPTDPPADPPTPSPQSSPQSSPHSSPQNHPQKRLVRSRDDRMVAGVCGGVAEYLGVDATLVRILVVVGTVLGFGSLLLAYLVGWVLIPEQD